MSNVFDVIAALQTCLVHTGVIKVSEIVFLWQHVTDMMSVHS